MTEMGDRERPKRRRSTRSLSSDLCTMSFKTPRGPPKRRVVSHSADTLSGSVASTKERPKHVCLHCGMTWNHRSQLVRHLRIHTNEKPFPCAECGRAFHLKFNLRRHVKTHTNEKPFQCAECGRVFTQQGSLTRHVKIHSTWQLSPDTKGGALFRCFHSLRSLNKHLQVQRDQAPRATRECKAHTYSHARKRANTIEKHGETCLQQKTRSRSSASATEQIVAGSDSDSYPRRDVSTGDMAASSDLCSKSFKTPRRLPERRVVSLSADILNGSVARTNERPKHVCSHCGKTWDHRSQLVTHLRIHTNEKPFQCAECGRAFTQQNNLTRHVKIHSNRQVSPDTKGGALFRCFHSLHSLNKHLQVQRDQAPRATRKCKAPTSSNTRKTVHTVEKHGEFCQEKKKKRSHSSASASEQTQQNASASDSTSYPGRDVTTGDMAASSDLCSRSSKTPRRFPKHRVASHSADTPSGSVASTKERPKHVCSHCGKTCKNRSLLGRHLRIHSNEKPFQCTDCGRAFKRPGNFRQHLSTHTDEKPFQCAECGRAFHRQSNLWRHAKTHTNEKPFQCTECGRAFNRQSTLRRHVKIHTKKKCFQCIECGRAFNRQSTLRQHLSIHINEKPFQCAECGRAFTQQGPLLRHVKIHSLNKHLQVHRDQAVGGITKLKAHTPSRASVAAPSGQEQPAEPMASRSAGGVVIKSETLGGGSEFSSAPHLADGAAASLHLSSALQGGSRKDPLTLPAAIDATATSCNDKGSSVFAESKQVLSNDPVAEHSGSDGDFGQPDPVLDRKKLVGLTCMDVFIHQLPSAAEHQADLGNGTELEGPSAQKEENSPNQLIDCRKTLMIVISKMLLHTCSICIKHFLTSSELDRHRKAHRVEQKCLSVKTEDCRGDLLV